MKKSVIKLQGISKIYNEGMPSEVRAVDNVDLEIKEGDFVSIMGPSGSGKTTLLDIIGCLMRPTYGKVFLDGRDTAKLTESELARLRGKMLGFIFQQYNLIKTFTAIENVALAIRINGKGRAEAEKKAIRTLETVGLGERMTHKPSELSGGESQRVAIARALANEPKIILGDEPTGNLDSKNGQKIIELLKGLHRKGYTIVLVTHDVSMNRHAQRCIRIMDGKIVSCAG